MAKRSKFHLIRNLILGLLILGSALAGARYLKNNPPEAQRKTAKEVVLQVQTTDVTSSDYTIQVQSFGAVQASSAGTLTAQVSGEVIARNADFHTGGNFNQGDVLITIDPRDYEVALTSARASVSEAQSNLAQEAARAKQAKLDWKRLGNSGNPSELVLRKPQLGAARARLAAAQASVAKAELDLQRTKIRAPYDGRIQSANAEIGQFVTSGTQLAQIYATAFSEVRLPLSNRELAQLTINPNGAANPTVNIHNEGNASWSGQIVRNEGVVDTATQQIYVVAQIPDGFASHPQHANNLHVGEFVNATINGRKLSQVLVIPNSTIYQGSYVYVVDADDLLQRRNISLRWQDNDNSVIESGLSVGERLVVTPLNDVISGTKVITNTAADATPTQANTEANTQANNQVTNQ